MSDNFSYIIAGKASGKAAVVDPSFNAEIILQMANDLNLNIEYVIFTHGHRDHISSNEKIKSHFGSKIVAHTSSRVYKDLGVEDGDTIMINGTAIKVIHTPGHSPDSICLLIDTKLLTGDTLFVGGCGRVDLPGGSARDLYYSFQKLMDLNDDIEIYPGHDYGSTPYSTIRSEKKMNYIFKKRSLDEFLNLFY
jgi:glyoxylase-like metal-dependent hydrolase (beta-lactamase superfamily II)